VWHITTSQPSRKETPPSKNEILRKIIHMSSFFVPILCNLVGLPIVTISIFATTIVYVISEETRIKGKNFPIVSSITRHAARNEELSNFAASPAFFALGILLTLLLFPSAVSSAAIAIFALGDSTASIFGRILGKTRLFFNRKKTLEGSLIGFAFAFLAGTIFTSPLIALTGAAVAMLFESLPLPLNDNMLVPLMTAVGLTLVT
jgi:dolichol kinase